MERTLIAPGVHLSCDPAEKFNRCRISIHFAFPAQRATATAHALLPLVLERGYAADILSTDYTAQDTGFADTRAYQWLTAYAAEYGFILRYPKDRQAITGVVFEPWHWRYVGVEIALAIRASGLSLEEFLAEQKAL